MSTSLKKGMMHTGSYSLQDASWDVFASTTRTPTWLAVFVSYIEKTCHDCVASQLSDSETTVGTAVNTHMTEYFEKVNIKSIGDIQLDTIDISAELLEFNGGKLAFRVEVQTAEENTSIVEGLHLRKIIKA